MATNISARENDRIKRIEVAKVVARGFDTKLYDSIRKNLSELGRSTIVINVAPYKTFSIPKLPNNLIVAAVDGSHIDVNRHLAAQCFLINIGSCLIKYGDDAYATLDSMPKLYASEENMVIKGRDNRLQRIQGSVLGIKRHIEELKALAALIRDLPKDTPSSMFLDGTLFPVGMSIFPQFVRNRFFDEIDGTMNAICQESQNRQMSILAYISYPGHSEIIDALRLTICDEVSGSGMCYGCIEGTKDRDLFLELLETGQRSAVFVRNANLSQSSISSDIAFFYLHTGNEIARIEMPSWTANRSDIIDLAHASCFYQSKKGSGYPTVLMEAHEQAIITASDRDSFVKLVELALNSNGIITRTSQKNISKRVRHI